MPHPLWYGEGLAFSCTQCGHCCTGTPGHVWVSPEEILALASHLGMETQAFGKRYLRNVSGKLSLLERPNGDCILYETGKGCAVYDARPVQCRTYPFWSEITASRKAWASEARNCPGMNQGRFYTHEEIAARVRETDNAEERA